MSSQTKKLFCLFFLIVLLSSSFAAPLQASISYAYDANGNLTSDGLKCYFYNQANQLSQVKTCSNNQLIAEYLYDHQGNRLVKKEYENGNLKHTIYSPDDQFETKKLANSTTQNTSYYYANSELVARKNPDGSKVFYHNDHLGSTSVTTSSTGALVEETAYDPYGEVRSGGTQSKFQYTGQEKDQETGLNYYGARYYDPHTRRFTQPDTMLPDPYDPQQLNRYSYVRNNPLKYTDSSGHCIDPVSFSLCAIAISSLATAVASDPNLPYDIADWNDSVSYARDTSNGNLRFLPLAISGVTAALPIVSGGGRITKKLIKNEAMIGSTGKYGENILEQAYRGGQQYFKVPGFNGGRKVDTYAKAVLPEMAHESKTGYQTLTKVIKQQIAKDKAMIADPSNPIREVLWHFFESDTTKKSGYSKPLENALRNSGMRFLLEGVEMK